MGRARFSHRLNQCASVALGLGQFGMSFRRIEFPGGGVAGRRARIGGTFTQAGRFVKENGIFFFGEGGIFRVPRRLDGALEGFDFARELDLSRVAFLRLFFGSCNGGFTGFEIGVGIFVLFRGGDDLLIRLC